jgi:g-D-glutamyl-meso-diaminopimelate peptidase
MTKWIDKGYLDLSEYKTYFTSNQFYSVFNALWKCNCNFSWRIIGYSLFGKPLLEFRIGNSENNIIHINAGMHANEWNNPALLMKVFDELLYNSQNNDDIRQYLNDVTLSIVPMVNPDGIDLVLGKYPEDNYLCENIIKINNFSLELSSWKANIRGVDLNNQFPAEWDLIKTIDFKKSEYASRDFPGPYPLSEPEAIALAELSINSNFQEVYALHSQGEEFYWGFNNLEPPESENRAREIEEITGYKAVRTIRSYGGYKDWFIQEFRRPGFTIEVGKGINPLPLSRFELDLSVVRKLILYCITHRK